MEKLFKHLDYIQDIINRMASNSFMLKGWAITLTTGIFVLASKDSEKSYFLIAFIPIIFFWLLDSYYLYKEKAFRDLYDYVRTINNIEEIDFSMNINPQILNCKSAPLKCLINISNLLFYLPLLGITIFLQIYLK